MLFRLATLTLLSLPFASFSQSAAPTPAPRYYVGLGVSGTTYSAIGGPHVPNTRPSLQLTAGYQLRPRLAVQATISYNSISKQYADTSRSAYALTPDDPYLFMTRNGQATQRNVALALLTRYTLTRQPTKRLQFDLLSGFTLHRRTYRDKGVFTQYENDPGHLYRNPYVYDDHENGNFVMLTVGPSVRYRICPQLEATVDATFSLGPHTTDTRVYSTNFISTVGALGLRYRFGGPNEG